MQEIKFRLPLFGSNGKFHSWHYWGFIEYPYGIIFVGIPIDPETAQKLSQQYTGKKDKHDKEIYKGDVVKVTCSCGYQENLPVEWQDGYNGFFLRATYQHSWDNDQLRLKDTSVIEVIGNIYQNPELLKEVK